MASVDWTDPGTDGNWSSTANWTGLVGESYPGEFAATADIVTIGASNSAYVVTFNVPSATISSLTVEGGNGTPHPTILRMTAGTTLNVQGGVTLFKKDSNATIDGAGTISVTAGITATGGPVGSEGIITAGTDSTGGVLELTGTGSISSPFVFAIGTVAPTTLALNLAGGISVPTAITINDADQTLKVGPLGSVVIQTTQNVTNGTILMDGGTLADASGISFGTNTSSGSLSGFGTVTGALTMSGSGATNTITAIGGNLTLSTAIGSNSGLIFAIGSTDVSALQLSADPGDGNTFTFLGSDGELALTSGAASGFDNSIFGLDVSSTLTSTNLVHILGEAVTVTSGQIGSGTTGTVTLSDGAVLHLSSITGSSGNWFVQTASDGAGGTEVFLSIVCFFAGTKIACPDGERAVETLSIGDLVLTSDDRVMPVRWIGRNTVSTRFADPLRVLPIRIAAGALADHLPQRDLLVSPDHAVLVDDILIQAGALVNGLSIVRESNVAETFVYYHIELAEHALVLAEGTPAESFVDNIHRMAFDNWDEHEALYGDAPIVEMDYPRARSHRQVPMQIRARLADRAETVLGFRQATAA